MKLFFLELVKNAKNPKLTNLYYLNGDERYYAESIDREGVAYNIFSSYNEESRTLKAGFRKANLKVPNSITDIHLIYSSFFKLYKRHKENNPSKYLDRKYLDMSTIYSFDINNLYIISELVHQEKHYSTSMDRDRLYCSRTTIQVYSIKYKGEEIRCPLIEMFLPRNELIYSETIVVNGKKQDTKKKTNKKVELGLTGKLHSFLYPERKSFKHNLW